MKTASIHLLLLRLLVGVIFVDLGYGKITEGWLTSSQALSGSLADYKTHAAGPQLTYLDRVAIPYEGIWSRLIALGEAALGVSLILGFLVRLSTGLGIVMILNLFAANGRLFNWDFWTSFSGALLVWCLFILCHTRAGRWIGIDSFLPASKSFLG